MQKRYVLLALLGLLVGYIAQTQYWFVDERDVYFPITREHLQNKVRAEKLAKLNHVELDAPALLVDIYNRKVLKQQKLQFNYFEKVKTYFAKQNFLLQNRELTVIQNDLSTKNKLSFLIAFSQYWERPQSISGFSPTDYARFLMDISKNKKESLLVRKQAYRNWLVFTGTDHQLANTPSRSQNRMAQLVSFSDEKLMDSLTAEN